VTEMSIGGEDYEGSITPVRSDISRFSRGTVESICMNCFLTISRTWDDFKVSEEELVEIEAAHECDITRRSRQF
jgi:hypothetical protein